MLASHLNNSNNLLGFGIYLPVTFWINDVMIHSGRSGFVLISSRWKQKTDDSKTFCSQSIYDSIDIFERQNVGNSIFGLRDPTNEKREKNESVFGMALLVMQKA